MPSCARQPRDGAGVSSTAAGVSVDCRHLKIGSRHEHPSPRCRDRVLVRRFGLRAPVRHGCRHDMERDVRGQQRPGAVVRNAVLHPGCTDDPGAESAGQRRPATDQRGLHLRMGQSAVQDHSRRQRATGRPGQRVRERHPTGGWHQPAGAEMVALARVEQRWVWGQQQHLRHRGPQCHQQHG